METEMIATTDQEITHIVTDADGTSSNQELKIQPDAHGMTVELPNGEIIIIDLSSKRFNIYFTDKPDEDIDEPLVEVTL